LTSLISLPIDESILSQSLVQKINSVHLSASVSDPDGINGAITYQWKSLVAYYYVIGASGGSTGTLDKAVTEWMINYVTDAIWVPSSLNNTLTRNGVSFDLVTVVSADGTQNIGHATIHLPAASGGDVTIPFGTTFASLSTQQYNAVAALQTFHHNDYVNITGETLASHVIAPSEVGRTLLLTTDYSDLFGPHSIDSQGVLIA
jgi:hypothetical protein